VLTPTSPITAPRIGDLEVEVGGQKEDTRLASTRFVRAINVLSLPALALPCGFSSARMPISAQLIGRPFDEALLFEVGAAIEDATEFHRAKPDLG
jgi:aspartyl-tRNA(Asn)/glutamyl-tRNA(Gln) amidotransferase subunit A